MMKQSDMNLNSLVQTALRLKITLTLKIGISDGQYCSERLADCVSNW